MPKGFQKGNKLWKLAVDSKVERKQVLAGFLEHVGVNGVKKYEELLQRVGNNESLSLNERLFMQKIENLFEYLIPKLSRTVIAGDKDNPLVVQPILVEFMNDKKDNKNT